MPEPIPSAARQALRGAFTHGLDDKQRLIIPSRWRQILGNPKAVCVMPNFDPNSKWAEQVRRRLRAAE